jgi:hypothetical protein
MQIIVGPAPGSMPSAKQAELGRWHFFDSDETVWLRALRSAQASGLEAKFSCLYKKTKNGILRKC